MGRGFDLEVVRRRRQRGLSLPRMGRVTMRVGVRLDGGGWRVEGEAENEGEGAGAEADGDGRGRRVTTGKE